MVSQFDGVGVVIDVGSQFTKAGFAGEATPRCFIPSTVGRFRRPGLLDGLPMEIYCGNEAVRLQGISKLTWPVEEGLIKDWDEMEKFWHHIFYNQLYVPPEDSAVMHSVNSLIPRKDKERMAEVLFEQFSIKGLYLAKSPVLVLHASGRTSGVVWENGYSSSSVTPVFEGFPLKHATLRSPMTGQKLSDRLQKLLAGTGYSFTTPIERQILDRMKAEMCYVATDYAEELGKFECSGENKTQFKLPDGQHVLLGVEKILCPECLFQPALEGLDCPSLDKIIHSSIDKCDIDYRCMFYNNIVIAGGSSKFPGLTERLTTELRKRTVKIPGFKVNIDSMPFKQFSAWAGGSLLASLDGLKGFWLTRKEYEDGGPEAVCTKFF